MTRSADEIASREFPMVRRGYDPVEVRSYLGEIADDLADPDVDAASERVADMLAAADAAVAERIAEADATLAAARTEAERLRAEGGEFTAGLEAARTAHEREQAARTAEADEAIATAHAQAAKILDDAKVEAEATYQGRWREAGDTVTRILETANSEAAALIEAAEAVATEIRANLQDELNRSRSDAERHAAEVRARADEFAEARLKSTESELAQANEALATARAEAERVEADAAARAASIVKRAEDRVASHIREQLATARTDLDRIRAVEIEAAARLGRVHELVGRSLDTAAESQPAAIDDPGSFMLRLAETPDSDDAGDEPEPGTGSGPTAQLPA